MYKTSYSASHRKFAKDERLASSHWNNKNSWHRDPVTSKKLQVRVPIPPSKPNRHLDDLGGGNLQPTEAQIATLPHYTDPEVILSKTENQMSFINPYRAPDFYFEEPNTTKKPVVQHLERSFIN